MFASLLIVIVTGSAWTVQARAALSVELPQGPWIRQCKSNPKPYFCFQEGNTKRPEVCPPPFFDAAKNFTAFMLKQFVNAPWYVQYQAPLINQTPDLLFCTRALYEPVDSEDIGAGLNVINYATKGVDGPVSGTFGPGDVGLFATVVDPTQPNKISVGPKFLRPLPNYTKYYSPYWIGAVGSTPGEAVDPVTRFTWAIITGGEPTIKSETGPGCRGPVHEEAAPSTNVTSLTAGPAQDPFTVILSLLMQLGPEDVEKLLAKIFDPTDVSDFDLASVLQMVEPIDLRPLKPLIEDEKTLEAIVSPVTKRIGGSVVFSQVLTALEKIDVTKPVSLSTVLASVANISEGLLKHFAKSLPTMFPDLVGEFRDVLRAVIVDVADKKLVPEVGAGLWLMTRKPIVSSQMTDELIRITRRMGLDVNVLQQVVQEGCSYEGAPAKQTVFATA